MSSIAFFRLNHSVARLFFVAAAFLCAFCSSDAVKAARPFVVGGRVLAIDRPFRPGSSSNYESGSVVARATPPKSRRVVINLSPPRVVPHYLPPEGDDEPRRYSGITVVAIPPKPYYAPDPATSVDLSPRFGTSVSLIPPKINYAPDPATSVDLSPRPSGLSPTLGARPGVESFRPSPLIPDLSRRR